MSNNYIVLTTQRTGSSMFLDTIDGYPNTEGHMELFLDQLRLAPGMAGNNDFPRYFEWKDANSSLRPFSVWKYLSQLYSRTPAVGFKLMYSHIRNYPEVLAYLLFSKTKVIHFVRKNYLDIVISEQIAEKTGKSHTTSSSEVGSTELVLDPQATLEKVRNLDSNTKRMEKVVSGLVTCEVLNIFYEDLLTNPEETLDQVKTFLGVDVSAEQVASGLKKRQTKSKKDVVSNYDEIHAAMTKGGFGHLLND